MNISSVIVRVDKNKINNIIASLKNINCVDIGLISEENAAIIVTIESDTISDELKILKSIEILDGVINANMHYSYVEDEIINDLETLNNYHFDENFIKKDYSGDINKAIDNINPAKTHK